MTHGRPAGLDMKHIKLDRAVFCKLNHIWNSFSSSHFVFANSLQKLLCFFCRIHGLGAIAKTMWYWEVMVIGGERGFENISQCALIQCDAGEGLYWLKRDDCSGYWQLNYGHANWYMLQTTSLIPSTKGWFTNTRHCLICSQTH